jgi:nucleoside-diphosphate-sugar epimerase
MKLFGHVVNIREVLPRAIIDLVIVYVSMLLAIGSSVLYHTMIGGDAFLISLPKDLSGYLLHFLVLSPVFSVCFAVGGFYRARRRMSGAKKRIILVRGTALGVSTFLILSYIVFGALQIGRSVTLPFLVLLTVGLLGSRVLKAWLENLDVLPMPGEEAVPGLVKPVLVVGGAGYIGSLLVQRLLEAGRRVRVLDCLMYGEEPIREFKCHPHFELMVGDCRNLQDVSKAMAGVGAVVHLAAIVGDPACEQDRQAALQVNYSATRMLIEMAKGNGIKRFVFASSCSVYGATDVEVSENSPTVPISLYGQTKVDSERVLLEAVDDHFQPTILRFATVFGLGLRVRFDLVVNLLVAKAEWEGVITIFNGQQWRPFLHVRDLVEAIFLSIDAPLSKVGGKVFNIGDSRLNHTLSDIADKIRQAYPRTKVENVENVDRRNYRVNFDRAQKVLGFQGRFTVEDGIREFQDAFARHDITDYKDIHYHNQRYMQSEGMPAVKAPIDTEIMSAYAGASLSAKRAAMTPVGSAL